MFNQGGEPEDIVEKHGLLQVSDTSALEKMIEDVIASNTEKSCRI